MSNSDKEAKRPRVQLPWWGWVLVGVAVLLTLPSLFSEGPLGIQETYGELWEDLQSIGENIWFFSATVSKLWAS